MTLNEKCAADSASSNLQEVTGFSNAFRSGTRESIKEGEILTIPVGADYKVYENKQLGSEGKHPQYINCQTNMGRVVELYPSMFTRAAFCVDAECKPEIDPATKRQKRVPTGGSVAKFVEGKAIDPTMRAMQGLQVKFHNSHVYKTREFGVPAEEATAANVVDITVGDWDFVGKLPEGFVLPETDAKK